MKLLNIFKFIWTNLGDFSELATIRFCYFCCCEACGCWDIAVLDAVWLPRSCCLWLRFWRDELTCLVQLEAFGTKESFL